MPATANATKRLLRSSLVDLLVGPHGVDRYLELIKPELTVNEARARIVAVRRQTPRSVTLTIRPNGAWAGFTAGQFVRVGVEIDGIRRTRTYSPASSEHRAHEQLELTISFLPDGLVSGYLRRENPGGVVHLGRAGGTFVLPSRRPERLVLVSGGSGITPVLSMLRTLLDERHDGEIEFIHYARTRAEHLYEPELRAIAAANPNVRVQYVATREGGPRFDGATVGFDPGDAHAAVCGPPALIDAVKQVWAGHPQHLICETFTPPTLALSAAGVGDGAPGRGGGAATGLSGGAATGTLRFTRSELTAEIGAGSLLEQAEAAGLTPEFGCRMGICHTCTCRKTAGPVRNLLTGAISDEEDEDIQLCVSVPAGDVALEL